MLLESKEKEVIVRQQCYGVIRRGAAWRYFVQRPIAGGSQTGVALLNGYTLLLSY
jgi:hypothetical protein